MYPQVLDYGAIGQYDCDAKCDAEYGPEGNITYKNGKVSDYRGVFCLQRKVLAEANYDLLGFMYKAAARSYRINRNRALMVGDGVNEPLGWLTADCFTKLKTRGTTLQPRRLPDVLRAAPVEYGPVTAVMHQNMFAYLASHGRTAIGRFIFGDGLMTYRPDDVRENIRISQLPAGSTAGLTKGSAANPFTTGDFLVAAGAWSRAYYVGQQASAVDRAMGRPIAPPGASSTCSVPRMAVSSAAAPRPASSPLVRNPWTTPIEVSNFGYAKRTPSIPPKEYRMNINVASQNQGVLAWRAVAASNVNPPIDIRHHVHFGITFQAIDDVTVDAVFEVTAAPASDADPCVPERFIRSRKP